jgi:hypothetical protein
MPKLSPGVWRGEIAEVCGQGNIVFRIENM